MSDEVYDETPVDDRATVLALLAMNGLTPSEKEIDAMVASYPLNRAMVAALYAMPGVRYEDPAIVFEPRVAP